MDYFLDQLKQSYKLIERQSLDTKRTFNSFFFNEMTDLLYSNAYIIADSIKTPFEFRFTGIVINGDYIREYGIKLKTYLGILNTKDRNGQALLVDRIGHCYVAVQDIYECLYNNDILRQFEGGDTRPLNQLNISDDTKDEIKASFTEWHETIFHHELSHIYDEIYYKGYSLNSGKYPWTSRHHELEAELTSLYNILMDRIKQFKSKEEFNSNFPSNENGLIKLALYGNTQIKKFYDRAKSSKSSVNTKKILRRLLDIKNKISNSISQ